MPHFIPIDSIEVPSNRQRREFDETSMQELITSISETAYGLQHPLVVRTDGSDDRHLLVAGERRLRAIRDVYALGGHIRHGGAVVPDGQVPVVSLGELDPIDAFEAELEENIRRRDLTVVERAQATAALMELRGQQAARAGTPLPSASDIAKEIFDIPDSKPKGEYGNATNAVRDQLLVAKHAADPEVRKATSLKEAVKIVKKKDEAARAERLAATVGAAYSANNLHLHHADAQEWLRGILPASFDVILTDPPYGMGAHEFGDSGHAATAGAHFYDDSYGSWQLLMNWFAPESFRLAKVDAHLYAFCDIDRFEEMRNRMAEAGWTVHRTPLIWHNPDGFRAPWPEHGPQRKYELILYARKGDRKVTAVRGDVLEYRKDPSVGHPAQKPVALLEDLLRRSIRPGDTVLDPFAGSGSTLVACHSLRISCTAVERDAEAYGKALGRLQSIRENKELF